MKIIFAGTPHFAASALEALLAERFEIVAVLTQPDRASGRGLQLRASEVKQLALSHGLPVLQPRSLKDPDIQLQLASFAADAMVVAAYGLILPGAVLQLPSYGCFNIHASLLPRWRGAAPIQRAILNGDTETGITIMQMDEGLDTGDMLLQKICPILAQDNTDTLLEKLAILGAVAIIEVLHGLKQNKLPRVQQDSQFATYASKLDKSEAIIDWTQNAVRIERSIRAYNPFPVATALFNASPIKIWQSSLREGQRGLPGTVLETGKDGIVVACGQGALCLEVLQRPNAKALPAAQFLQGFTLQVGDRFS